MTSAACEASLRMGSYRKRDQRIDDLFPRKDLPPSKKEKKPRMDLNGVDSTGLTNPPRHRPATGSDDWPGRCDSIGLYTSKIKSNEINIHT